MTTTKAKKKKSSSSSAISPARQLAGFLAKFTPDMAADGRVALRKMRARMPSAVQLVYDNYNGLVIGFGPSERASQALFSIFILADHISLCFLHGKSLPDPTRRLKGSGSQVRHIRLEPLSVLDERDVQALITAAIDRSDPPLPRAGNSRISIRAIVAKQRPRRPG